MDAGTPVTRGPLSGLVDTTRDQDAHSPLYRRRVARKHADRRSLLAGSCVSSDVESDRIFNILNRGDPRDWLFAGHTRADPVTWARNDCDRFYGEERPDTFSSLNIGAVQRGALYADMVKLIAESAARAAERRSNGRGVVEGRAIDV